MSPETIGVNIWLDVCGLFVIATILILHCLRKTLPLLQNRIYILILISAGVVCLSNVISVLTPDYVLLSVIMNYITVFFGLAIGALWYAYVSVLVNISVVYRRRWKLLFVPLVIVGIGLAANSFVPVFFVIDSDGVIYHGPLYFVLLVAYAAYFWAGVATVIHSRRYMTRERMLLFIPFMMTGLLGGLLDVLFPEWRVLRFALVLCAVIYYFALQNPDEYYDDDSPLFNEFAFEQLYRVRLDEGREMKCIAIYIRQLDYISTILKAETLYDIQKKCLHELHRLSPQCMLFRYSLGKYLVVVTGDKPGCEKKVYTDVLIVLNDMAKELADQIPFRSSTMEFECPRDAFSISGIENLIRHFTLEADRTRKDELTVADLGIQSERDEMEMTQKIRDALRERRFEVYFQPIYAPFEKKYTSAEALIRMRDEEGKFVSPAVFIPVAERNGLIIEISDYVLDEVCRVMSNGRLWERGMEYIEVNLSVTECLQKDLVDRVMETLEKYDLNPKHINLEITETASDAFSSTLDENIKELHRKGLSFSLDDFGTGYSSLNRILDLPLSLIKLDITIVRPAFEPGNDKAYALLECAVDIAKGVGTSIVAEGVETEEVASGIIDLGVDHIQGYYYSRPLPEGEFLDLVAAQ